MKEIKNYECTFQPTEEEIKIGMNIANENDCIVNLKWFFPYSGWYNIRIEKDTTFEEWFFDDWKYCLTLFFKEIAFPTYIILSYLSFIK